jgi:hypothetical protein
LRICVSIDSGTVSSLEEERVLLADIPEIRAYPAVSAFVTDHLSMQFGDVRSMMRLPLPDLGIGHACNFAATAVLCNLVSGVSVSLYMPKSPVMMDQKGKKHWVGSGEAFKRLLEDFYPWGKDEDGKQRARVLYDLFRNPFAHALGVHGKTGYRIVVARLSGGLQEAQLEQLERSATRPAWLPPGLSGGGNRWSVVAEGLYRDVFHMLWNLARNKTQMTQAEKRFKARSVIWRVGKP